MKATAVPKCLFSFPNKGKVYFRKEQKQIKFHSLRPAVINISVNIQNLKLKTNLFA